MIRRLLQLIFGREEAPLPRKTVFTQQEITEIRRLLTDKSNVRSEKKKSYRDELRKTYGFYISDFFRPSKSESEFTAEMLDELIRHGTVKVV